MLQQIIILSILYILGVLFAALFYPKISINLILSMGLFWGGLINTLMGILLGYFGWFKDGIWVSFAIIFIILVYINLRRKSVWENTTKSSVIKSVFIMLSFFLFAYLFFGEKFKVLTSSASFPYYILGSRIYNYGTIKIPGAGYDFRSQYGISEAMIHALGNFADLPIISLWHPFLWVSQYIFLFYLIIEFSTELKVKKIIAIVIGSLSTIWTATSPMDWLNSYYIHVHLFSSFALLISFSFFWRMSISSKNEVELALLSSLSLCGYGFSRVESPIFMLLVLGIYYINRNFSKAEYHSIFYPPLLSNIIWLVFLFLAYRHTNTQYWQDNRLLIIIGLYLLVSLFFVVNDHFHIKLKLDWIRDHFCFILLLVPLILFLIDNQRFIQTLDSVLKNMFGPLQNPGFGSWGFYWIQVLIFLIFMFTRKKVNQSYKVKSKEIGFGLFKDVILAYLDLILLLGFFREEPYTGIRWGDSASRMLTHISPLIGLSFGLFMIYEVREIRIIGSEEHSD